MDNRIKLVFATLGGLIGVYFIAVQIGNGNYIPAVLVGIAVLVIGVVLVSSPGVPFDGSIISISLVGVMIAGKGYSYLGVGNILYITELVLLCALGGYMMRVIFLKDAILPASPLSLPLLLLIGYMFFHLYFDRQTFGLLAFRDACVIYYTGFFLAAYKLAVDYKWRTQLRRLIILTFPIAILIMVVQYIYPPVIEGLTHLLTFQGRPIFLPHGDAADNAFLGAILFCFQASVRKKGFVALIFRLLILLIFAYLVVRSRGTLYVAAFAVIAFVIYARQWKFFRIIIPGALLGMGIALIFYSYSADVQKMPIVEKVFDELDSFKVLFEKHVGGLGAETASWRLNWWKWIYETVNQVNPVYGLGLGADLYVGFARQELGMTILADQAAVRGAHSAFFTILGRMGYVGAALFLWVAILQLWYFHKAAMMWRKLGTKLDPFVLYLQGALITFFCTTFLEYTWEGPYSALPFWVFSGVSYYLIDQYYKGKIEPEWNEGKVAGDAPVEEEKTPVEAPPVTPPARISIHRKNL